MQRFMGVEVHPEEKSNGKSNVVAEPVEVLLEEVGGFGFHQKRAVAILAIFTFSAGLSVLSTPFLNGSPLFRCSIADWPEDEYAMMSYDNTSVYEYIPLSDEPTGGNTFDSCKMFTNTSKLDEEGCKEYVIDDSLFGTTIVTEFSLYCDGLQVLPTTGSSLFVGGYVLGTFISGPLSDGLGRKKATAIFSVLLLGCGLAGTFSTSIYMFMAARFFEGAFQMAAGLSIFVWRAELVTKKNRMWSNNAQSFYWAAGAGLAPLLFYLLRNWRHVLLVANGPRVLLIAGFLIWVPESPRWLASKGRAKQALEVLQVIGRVNGRPLERPVCVETDDRGDSESGERKTLFQSFSQSPGLVQNWFILMLMWLSLSLGYYGLSFSSVNLVGDPYLNAAVGGLVEIPASALFYLINRTGRKKMSVTCLLIGGAAVLTSGCFFVFLRSYTWLITGSNVIGRFFTYIAFNTAFMWTSELAPTQVRSTFMSACSMVGRLAATGSPYLADLVKFIPYQSAQVITPTVIGSLLFLSGLASLKLPETTLSELPETFQKAAELGRERDDVLYHEDGSYLGKNPGYIDSTLEEDKL